MGTKIVRSLQGHEDIIESGLRFFVDVGESLMAIRDEKLYADNHDTFEAYCKARWGFAKSHAYRLIESASVVNAISETSPIGDTKTNSSSGKSQNVIPTNESQARAVADSSDDPKTRAKVWKAAVEAAPKDSDGKPKVTASIVKKAAESIAPKKPKPEPEPPKEDARLSFDTTAMDADLKGLKDSFGHEITNGVAEIFRHCTTFTSLVQQLGKIIGEVERLSMSDAGHHLNYDDFKQAIKQAQTILRFAKPYCPAPPLDRAKDPDQRKRWEGIRYLVEMEYRQLTDKQKAALK